MAAAVKFFLRTTHNKKTLDRMVQYMRDFGHGEARVARQGPFTVIIVDDRRDGEIFRHEFGRVFDAWVDYR